MARARGAAAALALVAGALCGIALVWGTAARRAELLNGIDGSLVVRRPAASRAQERQPRARRPHAGIPGDASVATVAGDAEAAAQAVHGRA